MAKPVSKESDLAVEQHVRRTLETADKPLSTQAIADRTGYDWKTVNDRLETMHDSGEIDRKEFSDRLTLWWDQDIPL